MENKLNLNMKDGLGMNDKNENQTCINTDKEIYRESQTIILIN